MARAATGPTLQTVTHTWLLIALILLSTAEVNCRQVRQSLAAASIKTPPSAPPPAPTEREPQLSAQQQQNYYDQAVLTSRLHRHGWRRRPRDYKVLFMTTFTDYVQRMDRYYYDLAEAAESHPHTSLVVWGPGFPGWQFNLTYGQNIDQRYACNFTFIYWANGNMELSIKHRRELEPCASKSTLIEEMHDCHHYFCRTRFHTGLASDIVISRYAFTLVELFDKKDPGSPTFGYSSPVKLLAHNPDCASLDKVQPKHFADKKGGSLLIGSTTSNLYPLRNKVETGISHGLITSVKLWPHPGYRLSLWAPDKPPINYNASSEISTAANQAYAQYTDTLADTHICVFDSSVVKKTIKKYMEAMLAGCVVASDMPFDMLGPMHDFIIPLHDHMPYSKLDAVIHRNLHNVGHLQELAGRAMHYALQHFTCQSKFDRLLDIYELYKDGFSGFFFPYGFKAGCGHTYVDGANPNWWCHLNTNA